jgi:alpha-beta hydrolase superfamily lysophospholipase
MSSAPVTEATPGVDGHEIRILAFRPPTSPLAVIQVLHGLGEHAGRYADFAEAAASSGFAVVAHDHRGHGPTRGTPGFFARDNGWDLLISDARAVSDWLRERYPQIPLALLGHSMGSYLAQNFAMVHGSRLSTLILSASTWPNRLQLRAGNLLARIECARIGALHASPLLDRLGFASFNRRFQPARTQYDWLSRDDSEVDRYIEDPLAGGPFTAGLWRDLTHGLLRISTDSAIHSVPADLPILITGGSDDPVGGERGMRRLALHYAQTGHTGLEVKIYAGGRHEMLHETNRDEVTSDWLGWLKQVLHLEQRR